MSLLPMSLRKYKHSNTNFHIHPSPHAIAPLHLCIFHLEKRLAKANSSIFALDLISGLCEDTARAINLPSLISNRFF